MTNERFYKVFIAGEWVGTVASTSPEEAVKRWIKLQCVGTSEAVAESHHCRVTDIWAEDVATKVYS